MASKCRERTSDVLGLLIRPWGTIAAELRAACEANHAPQIGALLTEALRLPDWARRQVAPDIDAAKGRLDAIRKASSVAEALFTRVRFVDVGGGRYAIEGDADDVDRNMRRLQKFLLAHGEYLSRDAYADVVRLLKGLQEHYTDRRPAASMAASPLSPIAPTPKSSSSRETVSSGPSTLQRGAEVRRSLAATLLSLAAQHEEDELRDRRRISEDEFHHRAVIRADALLELRRVTPRHRGSSGKVMSPTVGPHLAQRIAALWADETAGRQRILWSVADRHMRLDRASACLRRICRAFTDLVESLSREEQQERNHVTFLEEALRFDIRAELCLAYSCSLLPRSHHDRSCGALELTETSVRRRLTELYLAELGRAMHYGWLYLLGEARQSTSRSGATSSQDVTSDPEQTLLEQLLNTEND